MFVELTELLLYGEGGLIRNEYLLGTGHTRHREYSD